MDLPTDIITELYNIVIMEKDALTLTIMRSVCKMWNTIVKPFRLKGIHIKIPRTIYVPILRIRTESSNYREYSWNTYYHCFADDNHDHGSILFDNKILSQTLLWKLDLISQHISLFLAYGELNCYRPREVYDAEARNINEDLHTEIWLEYE